VNVDVKPELLHNVILKNVLKRSRRRYRKRECEDWFFFVRVVFSSLSHKIAEEAKEKKAESRF